jgi:PKD repeat protein
MEKSKHISILFLFAVVLCISTLGSVAAAEGVNNTTVISPNNNVNLNVSNDEGAKFDVYGNDTYNFFSPTQSSTQGQNELHISSSNSSSMTYGDVVATSNTTGTFYVTNTGGRGWNDDIILMIATNGTVTNNFNVTIIVSGYTWAPVPSSSTPAYDALTYQWVALNETFTISDFVYGAQIWKPAPGTGNYATPIFYGQDMTNTNNSFYIMFIDLYAGILKNGIYSQQLIDNGALKVQYIINGLSDGQMTAFNVYGFSNSSNQGQGIRWTNRIVSTGSSAYSVTGATPVASFTATPTNGTSPLNVQFTDTSSNNPTSWAWDFDNDGIIDSTLQNPTWTYNTDGTYTVTLTSGNSIGNNTLTQKDMIKVGNPELVASNLEIPSNPVNGTAYTVNTTVTNTGVNDAGSFVAKLYDNNAQVGKIVVSGLTSGASTILNFNWTPTTVGDHVLSVIADVNKQINETNRNNSQITQTVSIIASNLPELVTSNLQLPTNPVNATSYIVNVTVSNTGLGDAGSFIVKLYDNNVQIAKTTINGLASGANTILNFNWTPNTVGSHTLSVIADPNKQINEANRNNNQITQNTTTTASTLPDLTATNLQLPANPVVGTTYTINVTIANTGASDITSNFAVKLYDNNTQIQKITVTSLAAGASTILSFNWTPTTTGTHNLSVIADANKQLTEVIENNNQVTQSVTVS